MKNMKRMVVMLLAAAIVLGTSLGVPTGPTMAAPRAVAYQAVPLVPVVYDGSSVQVGLQQSDGNWATRTIDQRLPCLGKITVDLPIFSTIVVHLKGTAPEFQQLPVQFEGFDQPYPTQILVVPQDEVINDMQLNVLSSGQMLHIESEKRLPAAVIEMIGTTPVEIQIPPATRQLISIILSLFNAGDGIDLDDTLTQEIPNLHIRWVTIGENGRAEFVSPDAELPSQMQGQIGNAVTIRTRIVGAGSQRLNK